MSFLCRTGMSFWANCRAWLYRDDSCSHFGFEKTGVSCSEGREREREETPGCRLERIKTSRWINNAYVLPTCMQAWWVLLLSAVRIMVFEKLTYVLSPPSPSPSFSFLQPLPCQKQPGHLMLVASGEGCGRMERKLPGHFCRLKLFQRTIPSGRNVKKWGWLPTPIITPKSW